MNVYKGPYKNALVLGPGVWGQRFSAITVDPNRKENDFIHKLNPSYNSTSFGDKQELDSLGLFFWFDKGYADFEKLINREASYFQLSSDNPRMLFHDWSKGSENGTVYALSKDRTNLTSEEEKIASAIGLSTLEEKAVFHALRGKDLIIMSPSSTYIDVYLKPLEKILNSTHYDFPLPTVVSLTKGYDLIETDEKLLIELPHRKQEESLRNVPIVSALGPNISVEVDEYVPTTIVLATRYRNKENFLKGRKDQKEILNNLVNLFHGFNFTPRMSNKPNALAYGSLNKSLAALAAGMTRGYVHAMLMGSGSSRVNDYSKLLSNTIGTLTTIALNESYDNYRTLQKLMPKWEKITESEFKSNLVNLGDLVATASSGDSRNVIAGEKIFDETFKHPKDELTPRIKEEIVKTVVAEIGQAVESIPALYNMKRLMDFYDLDAPLNNAIIDSVLGDKSPVEMVGWMTNLRGYENPRTRRIRRFMR